jgi:hypothetical protein
MVIPNAQRARIRMAAASVLHKVVARVRTIPAHRRRNVHSTHAFDAPRPRFVDVLEDFENTARKPFKLSALMAQYTSLETPDAPPPCNRRRLKIYFFFENFCVIRDSSTRS